MRRVHKEHIPSSSAGPSKKQVREAENSFAIGGMRNPEVSVSRLAQVRRVGEQTHAAWLNFASEHPGVLEAAEAYGSKEAKIDEKLMKKWTERLGDLLEMEPTDGVTLKEALEFRFPPKCGLVERMAH